jgi:uncharacterized protein (TIGR00369 family)
MRSMTTSDIPAGFEPIEPFGQFHELIGPLYAKRDGESLVVAMRVEEKHGNRGRSLHGGMLCALADTAMTYACALRREADTGAVTTSLSIEMLGAARPGDWVEAEVDMMRAGKRVMFVNAFVRRGSERIARASATFQIVPRPGYAAAKPEQKK